MICNNLLKFRDFIRTIYKKEKSKNQQKNKTFHFMILNLNIKIFNKNYLTDENGNYPSEKKRQCAENFGLSNGIGAVAIFAQN